jgi:hypothetical protein
MNNEYDPAPSGLFLVPRRRAPPVQPAPDRHRRRAIAEGALIPLAVVCLAVSIFAGFDRNSWIESKCLLAPALPSITAFLGAAAGAWLRCRRSR